VGRSHAGSVSISGPPRGRKPTPSISGERPRRVAATLRRSTPRSATREVRARTPPRRSCGARRAPPSTAEAVRRVGSPPHVWPYRA